MDESWGKGNKNLSNGATEPEHLGLSEASRSMEDFSPIGRFLSQRESYLNFILLIFRTFRDPSQCGWRHLNSAGRNVIKCGNQWILSWVFRILHS